jgi:hypothetical protein
MRLVHTLKVQDLAPNEPTCVPWSRGRAAMREGGGVWWRRVRRVRNWVVREAK